jgi:hypothetical protein
MYPLADRVRVEIHHLLRAGKRMGHAYTIQLCPGHHRLEWTADQLTWLHESELVGIASGRKAFENIYGTERAMWAHIQNTYGWSAEWPSEKIVRRKVAA